MSSNELGNKSSTIFIHHCLSDMVSSFPPTRGQVITFPQRQMSMGIEIFRRCFVFIALLACLGVNARARAEDASPPAKTPKPELLVSVSHSAIRENDQSAVSIWISNDNDISLKSLNLRISSPDFLEWHDVSCNGPRIQGDVAFGKLAAHSVISRTLCLKSGPTVELGSLNILFTANFTWENKGDSGESFVSSEKPLTVTLLGTDTLGGVPLGIAALVAPGLLFWIVVSACGASWGPGIALGDKMIYSVLASALIMIMLSPFPYFGMRTGLSVLKLVLIAVIGAGLGLLCGGIDWGKRRAQRKASEAQTVRQGDDDKTVLGKLLRVYENKSIARTTVRLKDGGYFMGSLGEERADLVTLVGWFRVNTQGKTDNLVAKLKQLAAKKKYVELFDAAARNDFPLDPSDAIKTQRASDNQMITTGVSVRFWKPDDVQEVSPVLGEPQPPPIVVP